MDTPTIVGALSRAADDVTECIADDEAGLVVDLVVSVATYYLDHPGASVEEAIRASYPTEEFPTVQAVLDSMPHRPETREEMFTRLIANVERSNGNGNGNGNSH